MNWAWCLSGMGICCLNDASLRAADERKERGNSHYHWEHENAERWKLSALFQPQVFIVSANTLEGIAAFCGTCRVAEIMHTNKSQLAAALPWWSVRKSYEMCWHNPLQGSYVCLGAALGLIWIRTLPKTRIFLMSMAAGILCSPGSYPLWDTSKERLH